jgi:hypothetical protein
LINKNCLNRLGKLEFFSKSLDFIFFFLLLASMLMTVFIKISILLTNTTNKFSIDQYGSMLITLLISEQRVAFSPNTPSIILGDCSTGSTACGDDIKSLLMHSVVPLEKIPKP